MTIAVILVLVGSATHATWNLLASRAAGSDARLFVWASLASGVFHIAYGLGLRAAYARSDVNGPTPWRAASVRSW